MLSSDDPVLRLIRTNRAQRKRAQALIRRLDAEFGDLIRDAYERGGYGTGDQLARATGLSRARISQFKRK
ncbi:hypothetical protein [Nocardia sp. IFM 10818]